MNEKNQLKVAVELGMKFDEAMDLFSDETLSTMRMENVVGGAGEGANHSDCTNGNCGCSHNNCNACKCKPKLQECNSNTKVLCDKGLICEFTIALPEIPTIPTPTLATPKD